MQRYAYKRFPKVISCFGTEGDLYAPIIYADGSFLLRDRGHKYVTFGFRGAEKLTWRLKEDFLPCHVHSMVWRDLEVEIETFADDQVINHRKYQIVYSRVTIKNPTAKRHRLPHVSKLLTAFYPYRSHIDAGETVFRIYAVASDRYGGNYPYPAPQELLRYGSFNEHYSHMRKYWLNRLKALVDITDLPDKRLIAAYKAGYIYTQIVKDEDRLNVGENGYKRVFDHDVIGIISTLVALGDVKHFERYTSHILDNVQYPDARWKYALPYAQYLQKTGNYAVIQSRFDEIRENTHNIEQCLSPKGYMQSTCAIDADGYWLVDNWSALSGLTAYRYITETMARVTRSSAYAAESLWADKLYTRLLSATEKALESLSLDYLPVSVIQPNDANRCSCATDANWAAAFLFGRWAWDAYLLGANTDGYMKDSIDATYRYGLRRLRETGYTGMTFGGFPSSCSAYNAGYGSAALAGSEYRGIGIRAYQYLLDECQSAPYSWWEGIVTVGQRGILQFPVATNGTGSCPHMWGQALATKVLLDSLISEHADGKLIIGRGIPEEWCYNGAKVALRNFTTSTGKVDMSLTFGDSRVTLLVTGAVAHNVSLELPCFVGKTITVDNGDIIADGVLLQKGVIHVTAVYQ